MGLRRGGGILYLWDNALMIAITVQHHLSRARDFFKGMDLLKDDLDGYQYSSALLGIHSAVSYCDALRIGMGSETLSSDDHRSAAKELRTLLSSRRYEEQNGVDRLERLLGQKSMIAYSQERANEKNIKSVVQQAERFALWAERAGKRLRIEGWGDD
jgi:hypothetical protein